MTTSTRWTLPARAATVLALLLMAAHLGATYAPPAGRDSLWPALVLLAGAVPLIRVGVDARFGEAPTTERGLAAVAAVVGWGMAFAALTAKKLGLLVSRTTALTAGATALGAALTTLLDAWAARDRARVGLAAAVALAGVAVAARAAPFDDSATLVVAAAGTTVLLTAWRARGRFRDEQAATWTAALGVALLLLLAGAEGFGDALGAAQHIDDVA